MTTRTPETGSSQSPETPSRSVPWPLALAGLAVAAIQATRPRQWPKNLLVFAAPLAGATLGRADGFGYALVAFAAFTAASSAVYLLNDVMDAERDRLHPDETAAADRIWPAAPAGGRRTRDMPADRRPAG